MPRRGGRRLESPNAPKIKSLVGAISQHKGFKQMAAYNMSCLAKLITPPDADWEENLQLAVKSGGIAANIGIHFFDMLCWVFGPMQEVRLHSMTPMKAAGYLEFANARVRWFLSIDRSDLPATATDAGKTTFRNITINSQDLEFSDGFVDLHTQSYAHILDGGGYPVSEARQAIEIVEKMRHMDVMAGGSDKHPILGRTG